MATMTRMDLVICLLSFMLKTALIQAATSHDPLRIAQPSVFLETELNGYISLTAVDEGVVNVSLPTHTNGSIYLDGEDLLYIIKLINSLPPVWAINSTHGYLGEFDTGQRVNIQLEAIDPEGMPIKYERVAGNFPPGVTIDVNSGRIHGITPDADATYVFTIRATDGHGKYADSVFKIVVKGVNACERNPCRNEGVCQDLPGGFRCTCVSPFGGRTCDLNCKSNYLGVQNSLKWISDSQMTAHNTYSSSFALYARYGGSSYWEGIDSSSYLQIDLGNKTHVYGVMMQGASSSYYTNRYYMQYSSDGNQFYNATDYLGNTVSMSGTTSTTARSAYLPQVIDARFVRLFPTSWNRSYRPVMKGNVWGKRGNEAYS